MGRNHEKIVSIDKQIEDLQAKRKRLVEEDRIPDLEIKVKDYLEHKYSGKELLKKHSLDEKGFWQINGEDPNCDLGGSHHEPNLGVFEGTLKEALTYAIDLNGFFTWGGGGSITKVNIARPKKS